MRFSHYRILQLKKVIFFICYNIIKTKTINIISQIKLTLKQNIVKWNY